MLISKSYCDLNKNLHAGGCYGQNGDRWARSVHMLVAKFKPDTILDYGCGQGALGRALGRTIAEYDPAVPGKDKLPSATDLVVCTDVLEHVEPELIDNVLNHIRSVTKGYLFAVISTRPARKTLQDGRNAHLIVEPWSWWEEKMRARFHVVKLAMDANEVRVLLKAI